MAGSRAPKVDNGSTWHLLRAIFWVVVAPVILLTDLKSAVWIVILLSLYANFASDLSIWRAAKVEEHEDEKAS